MLLFIVLNTQCLCHPFCLKIGNPKANYIMQKTKICNKLSFSSHTYFSIPPTSQNKNIFSFENPLNYCCHYKEFCYSKLFVKIFTRNIIINRLIIMHSINLFSYFYCHHIIEILFFTLKRSWNFVHCTSLIIYSKY